MGILTITNLCVGTQTVAVSAGGDVIATINLGVGESRTVDAGTTFDAIVSLPLVPPGSGPRYQVTVPAAQSLNVTLLASPTGCVIGVGSASILFVGDCPLPGSSPTLTVVATDQKGATVQTTLLDWPTTAPIRGTFLIDQALNYSFTLRSIGGRVMATTQVSGADLVVAGALRTVCSSSTSCNNCLFTLSPTEKTGTPALLTIQNECKATIAVMISEVADGRVLTTVTESISAGGSVTYQASTDTPLVRVTVGGRAVTSSVLPGPARKVLINMRTGFCAPALAC